MASELSAAFRTRGKPLQEPTPKHAHTVIALWSLLQAENLPADATIMSNVVTAYSLLQCDRVTVQLYYDCRDRFTLFPFAMNYVLYSSVRMHDPPAALTLFQELESSVAISTAQWENLLFQAVSANADEVVARVHERLLALPDWKMPHRIQTKVIDRCIKNGQFNKVCEMCCALVSYSAGVK